MQLGITVMKAKSVALACAVLMSSACGKGDYSKVIGSSAYCEDKGGIVYEDPQHSQQGSVFCANGDHTHKPGIFPSWRQESE